MYAEQQTKSSNGLGIAAMVVGIIVFILVLIPIIGFVSWILSPLAVILGMIAIFSNGARISSVIGTATGIIDVLGCFWWLSLYNDVSDHVQSDEFKNRLEQSAEARQDYDLEEYESDSRDYYPSYGEEAEYETDVGDEDIMAATGPKLSFDRKPQARKQKDIFGSAE